MFGVVAGKRTDCGALCPRCAETIAKGTAVPTVFPYAGLRRFLLGSKTQVTSQHKRCFTLQMPDCSLNLLLLPRGRGSPGGGGWVVTGKPTDYWALCPRCAGTPPLPVSESSRCPLFLEVGGRLHPSHRRTLPRPRGLAVRPRCRGAPAHTRRGRVTAAPALWEPVHSHSCVGYPHPLPAFAGPVSGVGGGGLAMDVGRRDALGVVTALYMWCTWRLGRRGPEHSCSSGCSDVQRVHCGNGILSTTFGLCRAGPFSSGQGFSLLLSTSTSDRRWLPSNRRRFPSNRRRFPSNRRRLPSMLSWVVEDLYQGGHG